MEADPRRGQAGMSDHARQAAAEAVQKGDPERFAATMACAPAQRDPLWALYAANLEIARAPWASAEPMVAEMRLQWWVDAFDALAETGCEPQHELGPALAPLRAQAPLMAAIAEARRWDCWREPFADEAALWTYLDQTSGNLIWAAASALGAAPGLEARARDFGAAAGLAALFAAVPELEARGRLPLPDGRPETVARLAQEGLARIARARGGRDPALQAAFLPGYLAPARLKRAAAQPLRVAEGQLDGSEFARRAALLRAVFWRI